MTPRAPALVLLVAFHAAGGAATRGGGGGARGGGGPENRRGGRGAGRSRGRVAPGRAIVVAKRGRDGRRRIRFLHIRARRELQRIRARTPVDRRRGRVGRWSVRGYVTRQHRKPRDRTRGRRMVARRRLRGFGGAESSTLGRPPAACGRRNLPDGLGDVRPH